MGTGAGNICTCLLLGGRPKFHIFLKRIFSTKWQIPCIGTGLFLCGIKSGCLFGAIFTNPGPGGTNAMVEPKLQWQSVSSRLSFLLHSASYFLILITNSSKMSARCFLVDMLQLNMIFWCARVPTTHCVKCLLLLCAMSNIMGRV